jgi:hypothetical protein
MVIYIVEKLHPKYVYNKKYPLTGEHVASVTESRRKLGTGIERDVGQD